MDPLTIMGLGQVAGGLVGGLFGIGQKSKGKKILDNLVEPKYAVPNEVLANKQIAENRAATGLPSEQYQQAMKNIERNRTAAISASQGRRGALATISGVQANTDDALMNLDAADAQQRVANEKSLIDANNTIGQYKDRQYQAQKDIYDTKYNYGMQLMGAGTQNEYNGIDKGLGGAALVASGLFGKKNY